MKITILRGIPASGKSTYAKRLLETNNNLIRVNMDSLRLMFKNKSLDTSIEKLVKKSEYNIIEKAIQHNFDIIIDDTNLTLNRIKILIGIILNSLNWNLLKQLNKTNIKVEIKCDISVITFNTDFKTCLERDKNREHRVGFSVLKLMKNIKERNDEKIIKYLKYINVPHIIK